MSIKKLNLNLGANDPTKSMFDNFSYFSRWSRAIKSALKTIENEWNRRFVPFFSDTPTDEDIDPWVHGLDGKTFYTDANATSSNQWYWNTSKERPRTIKDAFDDLYQTTEKLKNDIELLKRRVEGS